MSGIFCSGPRLTIGKARKEDLDYIMELEYAADNIRYIVSFPRDVHEEILDSDEAMDILVREKETGTPVGYFMVYDLDSPIKKMEWRHVIIGKKGMGYGRESLKLMKLWTFGIMGFHRVWLDCKEYNERALRLYESEGFKREGVMRDTILTDGVYENLVVLGILRDEYEARKAQGLEL